MMSKPVDAWQVELDSDERRPKKVPHGFLWLLAVTVVLALELWGLGGLELREGFTPVAPTVPAVLDRLIQLSPMIVMNLLIVWVIKSWFTAMWVEGR